MAKAQAKTFEEENSRKDKLFEAWEHYLNEFFETMPDQIEFDDIYEGMCTVTELNEKTINLDLEDGRKLFHIQINSHVSAHSSRLDLIYIVLGKRNEKWWPLEVVSIGSILENEAQMTINPQLVDSLHRKIGNWVQS